MTTPEDERPTALSRARDQGHSRPVSTPPSSPVYSPDGSPQFDNPKALVHAKAACLILFGPVATRQFSIRYWDGFVEEAKNESTFTFLINRPGALRRMLLPPNELTIIEAVLSGDIEIDGDIEQAMGMGDAINAQLRSPANLFALLKHLRALPREDPTTDVRELRAAHTVGTVGDVHVPERDRAAIRYHYDVGNTFYSLWLDKRMLYSCAYFADGTNPEEELEDAQLAKIDLICRKLRLRPGDRLLDVGCGWGALIIHATRFYGVTALGITLSDAQAELARARIAKEGMSERCRVEIRDYRALQDLPPFDKIASVGMVEHVGVENLPMYFEALYRALRPGGLLLNHGIVSVSAARPLPRWDWLEKRIWKRDAFLDQYVFPDGRLGPLASVVAGAEHVGFETRDLESIREHYALTLRAWLARLMRHKDEAIRLTDERTFRIWRLYMAGSAFAFATGRLNVVQTLFARPDASGNSELPLRRSDLLI
ncbi:MAG: cyclopropane-fatty-acyl-phospholipid synthase family protein [Gemmatimonadota bacterium]|nr:cyclopropane-fatty-acyl-phospholipid synthase family protein [Gemmatimonadota bacterium]